MTHAWYYGMGDCEQCRNREKTRLYPARRMVPKRIKCTSCGGRAGMNTIGTRQYFRGPGGLSPNVESERKA